MPATQTVEFRAVTGQVITAKLFTVGSDTEITSVTATEATNRKGTYTAAFTDVAAGEYQLLAFNSTPIPVASWLVTLTVTTATFQVYDRVDKDGITRSNWAALTVDHTSSGSFGWILGILATLVENVSGWRFTTKAVEQAGGADVYVYPLALDSPQRHTYAEIEVFTEETGTQFFYARDSSGTALDLTGKTLEFRLAETKGKKRLYTAKTSDGTLTISLGNKVTFTRSLDFTRYEMSSLEYSLRDVTTGNELLLKGPMKVTWAP